MAAVYQQDVGFIPLVELLQRLKDRMAARGVTGIRSLGTRFRIMDDNGNKMLDKAEFSKALTELGISVNKTEFNALLKHFDKNEDGNISFDELLVGLRSDLTPRRKALVFKAFQVMDRDKSGELDMKDIIGRYDAARHPDVLEGKKTEQQVLREFLDGFEGSRGNHDGKVTLSEFETYYSEVSASIDTDDYFSLMMTQAWGITE